MANLIKDGSACYSIQTAAGVVGANGTYTYVLEPGEWIIEVWAIGTGVDVQVFPVTPSGTAMGTAYNATLVPTAGSGADPVTTALTVATGRRFRCCTPTGGVATQVLAVASPYVMVAAKVNVVLTNTSAITQLYLVASKKSK